MSLSLRLYGTFNFFHIARQPPLVACSSLWLNGPSAERILLRRRNASLHHQLQAKPWFPSLAFPHLPPPIEQPTTDQGRTLRKRKPQQFSVPIEDVSEEPSKRAKTTPRSQATIATCPSSRAESLEPNPQVGDRHQRERPSSVRKVTRSVSQSSAATLVESDRDYSPSTDTVIGTLEDDLGKDKKIAALIDVEDDDAESEAVMTRARHRASEYGLGGKKRARRTRRRT